MWSNTDLAKKDFLKYAEQYQTLASLVEYPNELHIDKLKAVVPAELRNVLVGAKLMGKIPTEWKKYLEMQVEAYKQIHPDKVRSSIFGNGKTATGNNNGGGKAKDPNDMEIDNANRSNDDKPSQPKQKFCQICSNKGFKAKSRTHNTNDCYDKPGNEGKRPAPKPSTSTPVDRKASGSGTRQFGAKRNFKARVIRLLEELKELPDQDDEDSDSPAEEITVNTAQLDEDGDDTQPAEKAATLPVDEAKKGEPSSRKGGKGKGKSLKGSWRPTIEDFQKDM